jgi:hypothetical protein
MITRDYLENMLKFFWIELYLLVTFNYFIQCVKNVWENLIYNGLLAGFDWVIVHHFQEKSTVSDQFNKGNRQKNKPLSFKRLYRNAGLPKGSIDLWMNWSFSLIIQKRLYFVSIFENAFFLPSMMLNLNFRLNPTTAPIKFLVPCQ